MHEPEESNEKVKNIAVSGYELMGVLDINKNLIELMGRDLVKEDEVQKLLFTIKENEVQILNTIPCAVFSVDEKGFIVTWNRRAGQITGFSKEEIIGKTCREFCLDYCREGCSMITEKVEKPIYNRLARIRTKSGELRQISKNIDVLRDRNGLVIGGIESFEDITWSLHMEQLFRESEERYAAIVNSAPETILIHKQGKIVFVNATGEHISGYEKEELLGRSLMDFLSDDSKEIITQMMNGRSRGDKVSDYEVEFYTKSGKILNLIVKTMPIIYEKEEAVLAVLIDISDRKFYEQDLRKATENAQSANVMKSQFLANVSHEIRTPINGIMGFLELLCTTNLSAEQKEYLLEAKSASEMLLYLINDILDFSSIEAGKINIENAPYRIRDTIEETISSIIPKACEKGIDINLFVDPTLPEEVIGDCDRLKQVLNNLLSNAVKFTDQGEVSVEVTGRSTQSGAAWINFTISDTGIGMEEDVQKKLFTPFTQADSSSTRKFGGTGLGLAISKEIVKQMGGQITVESKLGEGSVFCFAVQQMIVNPEEESKNMERLKNRNIVIIDEHQKRRSTITEYLKAEGCNVTDFDNASEGLAALLMNAYSNHKTDLVLLDSLLPEMAGFQLVNTLNQMDSIKELKKFLLLSSGKAIDEELMEKYGIEECLGNPIRRDLLVNSITKALQEQNQEMLRQQEQSQEEQADPHNPKILLVEDNEMNRKLMIAFLNNQDLVCDWAENGQEAVEAVMNKDYDMIFMDCQMPVMDGYESTGKIRSNEPEGRHTNIIAMTANAMEGDRDKCLAAGMDDYISKPIDFNILIQMITKYGKNQSTKYSRFIQESMDRFMEYFDLEDDILQEIRHELKVDFPKIMDRLETSVMEMDFRLIRDAASQLQELSLTLQLDKIGVLAKSLINYSLNKDIHNCHNLLTEINYICRR